MHTTIIKPSLNYVILGYVYTISLYTILVWILVAANAEAAKSVPRLILVLAVFLITPIRQHIRWKRTKTTLTPDEILHEFGEYKMHYRQLDLFKVERVHIEQGMMQKLAGAGTVYIKKFDEVQRLTLEHMDNPKAVAELIMERVRA